MQKFDITGMSCAACSARVEKVISSLEGVDSCTVSLLTNSATVEGNADSKAVISAVKKAGYGIKVAGGTDEPDALLKPNAEVKGLTKRLVYSAVFLALLMYFSMGHNMFGFPLPPFLENKYVFVGTIQMLLALVVIVFNGKFYVNGIRGVINRAPNMDTLVSMGSAAAFIYSAVVLIQMSLDGGFAKQGLHDLYFESSAMILVLITVGKLLEALSKGRTTNAISALIRLAPQTATILQDGAEKKVKISDVKCGDVFVLRSGESIPVDGIVIEGTCTVNESSLTGESLPVDKEMESVVSTGTVCLSGFVKCRAVRVGEDTTLSQIIKTVRDAVATKAPIAKIADKVSGVFVPVVIAIAVITTAVWLICGRDIGFALARGISVLVVSCPCALGLATPVAIMVGSGLAAKNGILFKNAVAIETAGKIKTVALDKTGTITSGEMQVTDIFCEDQIDESELLSLAASLESKSEHPLAKAIVDAAKLREVEVKEITDFEVFPGNGVLGKCSGETVFAANLNFTAEKAELSEKLKNTAIGFAEQGKTPVFFAKDGIALGVIGVSDVIKEDSADAIAELRSMGIFVVMLTGDNQKTAKAIADLAGTDDVVAEMLPNEKAEVISKLKSKGVVAMVGDGINDSPALAVADVGIAIGAGTDVAIDSADVVLMKSRITDVVALIKLSRAILGTIHQNLFWAFAYNLIGIPLAAGAFINLLGWEMTPMFGAAGMSFSSFMVVLNALRLNSFKLYRKRKQER